MKDNLLIVDSTCDLPDYFRESSTTDIEYINLVIKIKDRVYRDRADISLEEIRSNCEKNHVLPSTSPLMINDFIELYKEKIKEYKNIYVMTLSKEISSLYDNAVFAREQVEEKDRIHVLDSLSTSTGMALLVWAVLSDIRNNVSSDEIITRHEERTSRVRFSFIIDSLDYLYNGGRCSSLSFLIGNKLKLHPIVRLEKGKMVVRKLVTKKKIEKGVEDLVSAFKEDLSKGKIDFDYPILIAHTASPNLVKRLEHLLSPLVGDKILFSTECSPTIFSHCGPNSIGLSYMTK